MSNPIKDPGVKHLSRREYFVAHAMVGFMSSPHLMDMAFTQNRSSPEVGLKEIIAQNAMSIADEVIARLGDAPPEEPCGSHEWVGVSRCKHCGATHDGQN